MKETIKPKIMNDEEIEIIEGNTFIKNFMKVDGKTTDKWLRKILDFRKSFGCNDSLDKSKTGLKSK